MSPDVRDEERLPGLTDADADGHVMWVEKVPDHTLNLFWEIFKRGRRCCYLFWSMVTRVL